MRRASIAAVLFIAGLFSAYAASPSTITGTITDSEGAAIKNARVLVHLDFSGSTGSVRQKQDVIVVTDADGIYTVSVPPGFYDVFVSAMAFTPVSAKVRVKQSQHAAFNAALRADPLVTEELGHKIYAVPDTPEAPVIKSADAPLYPPLARQARIEGTVQVQVTTDGSSVIKAVATGHKMLVDAAEQNVKTWKFLGHRPQTFSVTFVYRVEPPEVDGAVNPTVLLEYPNHIEIRTKMARVETMVMH